MSVFIEATPRRLVPAIVDTGAYITLIPEKHWAIAQDEITWLEFPAGTKPAAAWTSMLGIGGNQIPARLGQILMTAVDEATGQAITQTVTALFAQDEQLPEERRLKHILIGLHFGLLDGRRLDLRLDSRLQNSPPTYLDDD